MQYDKQKFERLEQRSVELFATARHIDEALTDAIHRETEARFHLWSTIKAVGLPSSIAREPLRAGTLWLEQLQQQYEADPAALLEALHKADAWPAVINAMDDHIAKVRELARVRRRYDEHSQKQAAFNASFGRIAAFVRSLEGGNPFGMNVRSDGQPVAKAPTLAGFARGAS